jgi:hypothetical protein
MELTSVLRAIPLKIQIGEEGIFNIESWVGDGHDNSCGHILVRIVLESFQSESNSCLSFDKHSGPMLWYTKYKHIFYLDLLFKIF